MKKSLLLAACLLAAGVSSGAVATAYKAQWERFTSNGAAQVSAPVLTNFFGSQEVLDICLTSRWEAVAMADAFKGRKFSGNFVWLTGYLPWGRQAAWIRTVSEGAGKVPCLYALMYVGKPIRQPALEAFVLGLPDDASTNALQAAAYNVTWYAVRKSLAENRVTYPDGLSVPEMADFLLLGGVLKEVSHVTLVKERIKAAAVPLAKRSLRDRGKSFVTQDGVNPIELEMKPVVDALNAPKLQGLEAALRAVGVDIKDAARTPEVWDPVAAEKNAIFYGDKPAHPDLDGGIILLLGPEGYNAWVREFNEGK
jgi:hypothetical protein